MKTIDIASTTSATVTDATLNGVAARVLNFVTKGNEGTIKKSLAPLGWTAGVEEGWALLGALADANALDKSSAADSVTEAIAGCERWQATGLVRARAMLQLRFPEQSAFVFQDFAPGNGATALLNVSSFLRRRAQLDKGTERKASRKADHEALAVLDESGVTKAVLKELGDLVETAQTVADDGAGAAAAAAQRDLVLRQMHAWLTAWSDIARTVITGRGELMRLGLAKRRARKAKPSPSPAPSPPVVTPVVAPPVVTPPVVVAPPVVTPPVVTPPVVVAPPVTAPVVVAPPVTPPVVTPPVVTPPVVVAPPVATPPVTTPVNQLATIAADDMAPASRAA